MSEAAIDLEDEDGVLDPGCAKVFSADDMAEACRRLEAELERFRTAAGTSAPATEPGEALR